MIRVYGPKDYSPPGISVCGILQARILKWVAIPFSRGSLQPRDQAQVSRIAGRFFIIWATREALRVYNSIIFITFSIIIMQHVVWACVVMSKGQSVVWFESMGLGFRGRVNNELCQLISDWSKWPVWFLHHTTYCAQSDTHTYRSTAKTQWLTYVELKLSAYGIILTGKRAIFPHLELLIIKQKNLMTLLVTNMMSTMSTESQKIFFQAMLGEIRL